MSHVTSTRVPDRSRAQSMAALARANEVRIHRAQVKQDLKAGRTTLEQVMTDPLCAGMKLREALLCLPLCGPRKTDRTMFRARISPAKTLGGLTARQRRELVQVLAGYPAVWELQAPGAVAA